MSGNAVRDAGEGGSAALALTAIFCGVLASVALKLLSVTPPAQAIAERSFIAAVLLAVLAAFARAPLLGLPLRAWLRALLDAVAGLCFALAVFKLPLALLSAILATLPLVASVMSRLTLAEPIGPARWAALMLGLAGVLCIVRPSLAISPAGLALAVVAVLAYATRDITTRHLPSGTATLSVALASALMIGAGALALPQEAGWIVPPAGELGLVASTSLCFITANTLVIMAFRRSSVSAIAPLRYTAILWSLLFDLMIWGVVPDALSSLGIALIFAAGAMMLVALIGVRARTG